MRADDGDFAGEGCGGEITDWIRFRRFAVGQHPTAIQRFDRHALQLHVSLASGQCAGEQLDGRGFAGAGRSDYGGDLVGQCVEAHVAKRVTRMFGTIRTGMRRARTHTIRIHIPVRNPAELHADALSGSPEFRQFPTAALRFWRVQQCENTFRGRHAVHSNMEIRAKLT